jgi:hypothetical protein
MIKVFPRNGSKAGREPAAPGRYSTARDRRSGSGWLLEVVTYPDARAVEQVVRNLALVLLDRELVPEALVLFLRAGGNAEAAGGALLQSRQGWTQWPLSWRVVKLVLCESRPSQSPPIAPAMGGD